MKEAFLHFVWKYGLFNLSSLTTTEGEEITIVHRGTHNFDQGADFQGCKIKIGENTFVGNVEIHIDNSDWYAHNHQFDPHYNNTILHVIYADTLEQYVLTADNTSVPILCLKKHIAPNIIQQYQSLTISKDEIPCSNIAILPKHIDLERFKEKLVAERMIRKSSDIKIILEQNNNNWEMTFFRFLFASFGIKVNKDIFFQIAQAIPLNVIAKHKDNLFQLEALFYGQSNLLNTPIDEYTFSLKKEYQYLKRLYNLTSPKSSPLFLRMRPISFPTIRISQFANLIHQSSHLFSAIMECKNLKEIEEQLICNASPYWNNHYTFGIVSPMTNTKKLGNSTIESIIINAILPFLFLYENEKYGQSEKTLEILREIKSEKNSKIQTIVNTLKVSNLNAFDSQAWIQLYDHYCIEQNCLNCAIGFASLKGK